MVQRKANTLAIPIQRINLTIKGNKLWQTQVQAGFGLRAVMTVGNTPATSGQSEYKIQTAPGVGCSKVIQVLCKMQVTQGFLQDASFATLTDDGGNGGSAFVGGTDANLLVFLMVSSI